MTTNRYAVIASASGTVRSFATLDAAVRYAAKIDARPRAKRTGCRGIVVDSATGKEVC